jgi:hypothetical protein
VFWNHTFLAHTFYTRKSRAIPGYFTSDRPCLHAFFSEKRIAQILTHRVECSPFGTSIRFGLISLNENFFNVMMNDYLFQDYLACGVLLSG